MSDQPSDVTTDPTPADEVVQISEDVSISAAAYRLTRLVRDPSGRIVKFYVSRSLRPQNCSVANAHVLDQAITWNELLCYEPSGWSGTTQNLPDGTMADYGQVPVTDDLRTFVLSMLGPIVAELQRRTRLALAGLAEPRVQDPDGMSMVVTAGGVVIATYSNGGRAVSEAERINQAAGGTVVHVDSQIPHDPDDDTLRARVGRVRPYSRAGGPQDPLGLGDA